MFESQVTEAYSPFLTTTVVSRPLFCCLDHWCDLPVPVCIVDHNQRTLIAFFLFSIFFSVVGSCCGFGARPCPRPRISGIRAWRPFSTVWLAVLVPTRWLTHGAVVCHSLNASTFLAPQLRSRRGGSRPLAPLLCCCLRVRPAARRRPGLRRYASPICVVYRGTRAHPALPSRFLDLHQSTLPSSFLS